MLEESAVYNGYTKLSVDIDGKKMVCYEKGKGEVTCIFSCGWAVPFPFSDMFEIANILSLHCRCVIFDRFGYGFSEITDGKRDFSSITRETKALCKEANILGNVVFIGHSLATYHALDFAKSFPEMVKGLVLIDCYFADTVVGQSLFHVNKLIACYFLFLKKIGIINKMDNAKFKKILFGKRKVPDNVLQDSILITKERVYNKTVCSELNCAIKDLKHLRNGLNKLDSIPIIAVCRNLTYKSILSLKKHINSIFVMNMGRTSHFIHHEYPENIADQIIEKCIL